MRHCIIQAGVPIINMTLCHTAQTSGGLLAERHERLDVGCTQSTGSAECTHGVQLSVLCWLVVAASEACHAGALSCSQGRGLHTGRGRGAHHPGCPAACSAAPAFGRSRCGTPGTAWGHLASKPAVSCMGTSAAARVLLFVPAVTSNALADTVKTGSAAVVSGQMSSRIAHCIHPVKPKT